MRANNYINAKNIIALISNRSAFDETDNKVNNRMNNASFVSVFSAVRNSVLPGATNPVPYDVILVDTNNGFDAAYTKYTVKSAGFYLIHMSVGVPRSEYINYGLQNTSSAPNILLTHRSYDGELVTSRNDIQYLNEGQVIYMSSGYTLYSDSLLQTTWSGINLNDIMKSTVIIRGARTSPYTLNGSTIPLENLQINIGQIWDSCTNRVVVPQTGYYFLSWSSASLPNTVHRVRLLVNGECLGKTMIYGGYYDGNDVSSQTLILKLNASDVVTLHLYDGSVYSDSNYQTSLIAFLYEPKHGADIAWTLTVPDETFLYGPTTVNFTNIYLNKGNVWNSTTMSVKIPISGVYYLTISGLSYPIEYPFNLVLSVNGKPLINVMEKIDTVRTIYHNLRSRSLMIHLDENDELITSIPIGYNGYNIERFITFSGFLAKPDYWDGSSDSASGM